MLQLERLEERSVPAATVRLLGTTLVALADVHGSTIQITQSGSQLRVLADGKATFLDAGGVQRLTLVGAATRYNDLANFTGLSATLLGGQAGNMLQGGSGADNIVCGRGSDTVYDVVGTNRTLAADGSSAADTLFVNAASFVQAKTQDQVVRLFATGRTPGSGSVQLQNRVLYLTPSDQGTITRIRQSNQTVIVTTNYQGVFQTQRFARSQVQYLGYFGGAGDDLYHNESAVSEVGYGGLGGNDTLLGGYGKFSFLKGGSGDDLLLGRGQKNDLAGNAGSDLLLSWRSPTVFRADPFDLLFGRTHRDTVIQ